jgi:uncharacterized membrane protein
VASLRRWLAGAWDLVGADLAVFSLAAFLTIAGSLLSVWILAMPLTVGLCIMFLEKLQGNKPTLRHLAEGLSRFPAAVFTWAVYLVCLVPFSAAHVALYGLSHGANRWGTMAEVLGHLVVATPLLLTAPLIAHLDVGGREAVSLSWTRVRTILPLAFVTVTILSVLLVAGLFACGVGIIITLPVTVGALVLAYRELNGQTNTPEVSTHAQPGSNTAGDGPATADRYGAPGG